MNNAIDELKCILHPKLQKVLDIRGFDEFSEIQLRAIPKLIFGENAILIAPTGTGKTESALLPIFHNMLTKSHPPGFTTLYITPLRSLNRDMMKRLTWWGSELGIRIDVRHGDTTQNDRRKQSTHPPDLLITTPESLQAMFMGKVLRKHLSGVRYVVVDEIHELAGSKRGAQLSVALERLAELSGEFQRIGISATVGNPDEIGKFLCGKRPCSIVQVPVAKSLDLSVIFASESFKEQVKLIEKCIDAHTSTLVFTNTRSVAEAIGNALNSREDVDVHHGSLSREVRIDAEDRFREGKTKGMICTSSMELGIDIGQIDHVVQFNSPREVARLMQRTGRAGHQIHSTSKGIILATGFDDILESMVIVRLAKDNKPENARIHFNAADVIANQIAALAVERGEISIETIEKIITRSYCFENSKDLIREVIKQMEKHYLIRTENGQVITKARARKYLSQNLSMIADEKKCVIFDVISRKPVGTLDESFVISWISSGAVFVARGQVWRVLELEDNKIMVEPAKNAQGELPSWEGEQIPVPFTVAMEAGALRRLENFEDYYTDSRSILFARKTLGDMRKNRTVTATDKLIVLEDADEGVVVNLCAGHKVNEAIGRVLSILISARYGSAVGIETNAYRIYLRLPNFLRATDVEDILLSLTPDHIEGILQLALKKTSLYKWRLVQVAKKFGAIDADADYEKISMNRLLELFDGTVIEKEAFRELFFSSMDSEGAKEVARRIQNHEMETRCSRLSIIGAQGLFSERDMVTPPGEDQAILESVKHRLAETDVVLACMHCRSWKSRTKTGRVPDDLVCPVCGARLIAVIKPYEEPMYLALKKKKLSTEEKDAEKRMMKNANMVLSSGKKAVIALSGRGVGPDAAARILATFAKDDNFYREILKAERKFVQTHQYWG
ncbi:MAG TPA: DEAD/DEAH box helicase [Methanocorpusculum sp.]|nr:DEAD/DEAH box helicase [Methanocorpusculum sp.]HJJ40193.1 DEAD/DEAH box helicase [Methanocorpusculum sp.]HJJ49582.1 DEAD/DEAH box helicase [Methanocorpusculum sp.]HJJ57667.1 DEAD/DEAH box helicase [Methanocorpusculum sp.]